MQTNRLELESQKTHHRAEWKCQRIAWTVWLALIVAALLGFLGPGPFNHRRVASQDGSVTVDFEGLLQHHNVSTLRLKLLATPPAPQFILHISRGLLDAIELETIQPEPMQTVLTQDGAGYVFGTESRAAEVAVTVHFEPEGFGRHSGTIRLNDGAPVVVSQFVYP